MSGGKWTNRGPRIKKPSNTEMDDFFRKAAFEKQEFDARVRAARDELQKRNAEIRAQAKRDLDDEYRNYIPPIV